MVLKTGGNAQSCDLNDQLDKFEIQESDQTCTILYMKPVSNANLAMQLASTGAGEIKTSKDALYITSECQRFAPEKMRLPCG